MSYFNNLPDEVQTNIYHYIPYRQNIPAFIDEYKIFLQDWKNQCQSKQWNGLDPDLYYETKEIPFLHNAYFKHQHLKKYYNIQYSLEKGITWKRNNYRRHSI